VLCAAIQNEVQILLTVKTCLSVFSEDVFVPVSPFLPVLFVEALYSLHALPSQTVCDFLSQQHYKVCHFISDITDFFFGWQRPATNQSS